MRSLVLACCLVTACDSLETRSNGELPEPQSVAVLPFQGEVSLPERDLLRTMVADRLRVRKVQVADSSWVDRRLTELGLLDDPKRFDVANLDVGLLCRALGVDGILVGRGFAESQFNVLLLFRHGLHGELEWLHQDGRTRWRAKHSSNQKGGLALRSGQVFTALAETETYGTSLGFILLVEAWLDRVLDTLPEWSGDRLRPAVAPPVASVETRYRLHGSKPGAGDEIVVEAKSEPGARLFFSLSERARNLPMVEIAPGSYRGSFIRVRGDDIDHETKARVGVRGRFVRSTGSDL